MLYDGAKHFISVGSREKKKEMAFKTPLAVSSPWLDLLTVRMSELGYGPLVVKSQTSSVLLPLRLATPSPTSAADW